MSNYNVEIIGDAQALSAGINPAIYVGKTGATPEILAGTVEEGDELQLTLTGATPEKKWLNLVMPKYVMGAASEQMIRDIDAAVLTQRATGNPVVIDAAANRAPDVTVECVVEQEGTGDASPSNVRPIVGRDVVDLTVGDHVNTYHPTRTLYGLPGAEDEVDMATGVETYRTNKVTLTGGEVKNNTATIPGVGYAAVYVSGYQALGGSLALCSHLPMGTITGGVSAEGLWVNSTGDMGFVLAIDRLAPYGATADRSTHPSAVNAFLAAQYAAGTPVTLVYKLATPEIIQGTPVPMWPDPSGTTTIMTDADSMTVKYAAYSDTPDEVDALRKAVNPLDAAVMTREVYTKSGIAPIDADAGRPIAMRMTYKYKQAPGTPSPDAPIAIEAATSVDLGASGKNLLNTPDWSWVPDKTVSTSNGGYYDSPGYSASGYIPVSGGAQIAYGAGFDRAAQYDNNKTFLGSAGAGTGATGIVLDSRAAFLRVGFLSTALGTAQIELGDVATTYTPYTGDARTQPTQSPLADADVTLDVAGRLRVEHRRGLPTYDGSVDEGWHNTGVLGADGSYVYGINLPDAPAIAGIPVTCTHYINVAATQARTLAYGQCGLMVSSSKLYAYFASNISTLAGFLAALAASPMTLVYDLATPIIETYDLPPLYPPAQDGETTVMSNADTMLVQYAQRTDEANEVAVLRTMIRGLIASNANLQDQITALQEQVTAQGG